MDARSSITKTCPTQSLQPSRQTGSRPRVDTRPGPADWLLLWRANWLRPLLAIWLVQFFSPLDAPSVPGISSLLQVFWFTELTLPQAACAEGPTASPESLHDAELNDVLFLDEKRGWAVGDRGAIWKTDDAGRTWRHQESPANCRWENIHFVDDRNGWIVGGNVQPNTWQSRGALVRTRDGGQNWMPVSIPTLPGLRRVRFVNERVGWAAGDPSALYPSGVFRTEDGGRSWTPVATGQGNTWHAMTLPAGEDVHDGRAVPVMLAGSDGHLLMFPDRGGREPVLLSPADERQRPVRNLRLANSRLGWLIGDQGLVLQTQNQGLAWHAPKSLPAAPQLEQFDWNALETHGSRAWIAGAPGSLVLSTADQGKSWQLVPTGQTAPLRAIDFVDEQRGWAVGALGTILTTSDGGQSWRVQRTAGRLAILAIQPTAERLPLELFASLSGNEGYLSGAEVIFERPANKPVSLLAPVATRAQAAVVAVGGSTAHLTSRFPAPARGLPADVDQEQLDAYLVRLIRQWRPEIVVIETPSRRVVDAAESRLHQVATLAVQRAAQANVHPEQIEALGLTAWRAKKLIQAVADEERGTLNLSTTQLLPRQNKSVADVAATGYRFVRPASDLVSPANLGFRLAIDLVPQEMGRRDFLSGITLTPGGDGRRNLGPTSRTDLTALTRVAQQQRNIQALLTRSIANPAQTTAWLRQVDELGRGLGKAAVGDMLWQLAQRFQQQGQMELAARALEELVRRDQRHELAESSLVWLVQYHASEELAWRQQKQQLTSLTASANQQAGAVMVSPVRRVGSVQVEPVNNSVQPAVALQDGVNLPASGVTTAGGISTTTIDSKRRGSVEAYREFLERNQPAWTVEPSVRLPSAAWLRRADRVEKADRAERTDRGEKANDSAPFLKALANSRAAETWAACAQNEIWLARSATDGISPQLTSGRPVARLARHSSRPRLDGDLSDEIWNQAARLSLQSAERRELKDATVATQTHQDPADAELPAESDVANEAEAKAGTISETAATAWLAMDGEFLYLAARCPKPRASSESASQPAAIRSSASIPGRVRDADLRERDRVEFILDVDRDYTTAWHLTIDDRGWTAESCWGDRSWNPTWYVAQSETATEWIVEAAIPFEELGAQPPTAKQAWSVQVQRHIPGKALESWSQPASDPPRLDGSGLLLFR